MKFSALATILYAVCQILELCAICSYNSKMTKIDAEAGKGEMTADELVEQRVGVTGEFG